MNKSPHQFLAPYRYNSWPIGVWWVAGGIFLFLLVGVAIVVLATRENLEAVDPLPQLNAKPGKEEDTYQHALLAALEVPGGDDPTVTADLKNLMTLQQNAPDILKRYLATNPAWRVFQTDGKILATRRWMIGAEWQYSLHGYYTDGALDDWGRAGIPHFQSRLTIGLSGQPWADIRASSTEIKAGNSTKAVMTPVNELHESHCVISAGPLVVEVFEQSLGTERRLTKAGLAHLEKELAPLVTDPTWQTIRAILPPNSIRIGEPSFQLRNGFQPGIYHVILWTNPGEPGMLYLKAPGSFSSNKMLKWETNERIGWSDSPDELFFSNTRFTNAQGSWSWSSYAGRFEVWFVPDSGGTERKLIERVFRVEDWSF